jgi:hypothetical protein
MSNLRMLSYLPTTIIGAYSRLPIICLQKHSFWFIGEAIYMLHMILINQMCIQKGSEHEIRSQVTFEKHLYRVVAHWYFYDWNTIGYMRESLGSHARHIIVLVPNKDPDVKVVVCFTSREWRWRWLFALLKLVEMLTSTDVEFWISL